MLILSHFSKKINLRRNTAKFSPEKNAFAKSDYSAKAFIFYQLYIFTQLGMSM